MEGITPRTVLHRTLDEVLDRIEREKFIEGRKSALNELIPHTTQYKKANKTPKKK